METKRYTFSPVSDDNVEQSCFFNTELKGNAQFIFLCNPQKSSVNVCLKKILKSTVTKEVTVCVLITWVKKTLKTSSFCNISDFRKGFV